MRIEELKTTKLTIDELKTLFEGVWVQTVRHRCPTAWGSLALPAVFPSGPPGVHVAQTLRFSRFIALPRPAFAFKAFLAQNRALLRVWRTVFSRPRFLSSGLAFVHPDPKSLQFYSTFCVHSLKTIIKAQWKLKLCALIGHFDLLAAVL